MRPAAAERHGGEREDDRVLPGVEEDQERVVDHRRALGAVGRDLGAVQEDAERERVVVAPVALRHLPSVRPEPPDVGLARAHPLLAGEEVGAMEDRMLRAQLDQALRERELPLRAPVEPPVDPRDLVVLAVGVVVPALGAGDLVAAEQHRHALREEERREEVPQLPLAERVDRRIVGLALDAVVPAAVVVVPVLVRLEIRLVVLLVVGDEVAEREAVVRGDEVDRRERPAPVVLVEVARAGEAGRELADGRLAAPEVAHRVAVHPVPLGPEHREVADLVAALADVPRLGDQLHLGQDRILVDDVEEGREPVDLVELARERRREVEAEAVDVALDHEVAQRVHDQPQHRRMHRVERVARCPCSPCSGARSPARCGSRRRCRSP